VALPTFAPGSKPLASTLNGLLPLFAYKGSDSGYANTTLTNDPDLFVTPTINRVYTIEVCLLVGGIVTGGANDIKLDFTFPTSAILHYGGLGKDTTADSGASTAGAGNWIANQNMTTSPSTSRSWGVADTNIQILQLPGLLVMGGTAGNLQLRAAQLTSRATNTTVKAGSWIKLQWCA
jgi:hypothetical protein